MTSRSALLLLLALAGCGQPQPTEDPLAYLRVGVDPATEADSVASGLEEHGYALARRIDGPGFAALAMVRPAPAASAVRVVTSRGIALALDMPRPDGDGPAAAGLLDPEELGSGLDLDGDGRPEVVVTLAGGALGRTCLVPLRVEDDGGVLEVPITDATVSSMADAPCVERFADVDGDGGLDALVVVRLAALARGVVPRIDVPFTARRGQWARGGAEAYAAFYAAERERRAAELERVRQELDIEAVYVLAVELAALARVTGASRDGQVGAFDAALSGLVLPPQVAQGVAQSRALIAAGFRQPGPEAVP